MPFKSCPVQVKAAGTADGLAEGQFRAVVSVFGNKDSYGDIVMPGAFAETLAEWAAKGTPIPVFWSHQMSDPEMCIGEVIEAKETDQGLEVLAQLDIDDAASPKPSRPTGSSRAGGSRSSRSRTTSSKRHGSRPTTTTGTSCVGSSCTRSGPASSAPTRRPSCWP